MDETSYYDRYVGWMFLALGWVDVMTDVDIKHNFSHSFHPVLYFSINNKTCALQLHTPAHFQNNNFNLESSRNIEQLHSYFVALSSYT